MTERNEGGLWCHQVLTLLDRYVDGDLDASELAAVQAHVGACGQCARFGGAYAKVVATLRGGELIEPEAERLRRLTSRVLAGLK